ncbi:hypothetical protein B0T09DRAFT_338771 [Sordaria sp. MPI-SDFR-AT-0083]|nr:hypothetical protein B0T09DRAFT_338771 [Sordaria sp. MPI-SDFR-AT-0083]
MSKVEKKTPVSWHSIFGSIHSVFLFLTFFIDRAVCRSGIERALSFFRKFFLQVEGSRFCWLVFSQSSRAGCAWLWLARWMTRTKIITKREKRQKT